MRSDTRELFLLVSVDFLSPPEEWCRGAGDAEGAGDAVGGAPWAEVGWCWMRMPGMVEQRVGEEVMEEVLDGGMMDGEREGAGTGRW